ncbi:MAG: hypothetical protein NDJ19_16680 [Ramlibacter sp.]|nr:hypothetical protein [Ramlibacter sp.]
MRTMMKLAAPAAAALIGVVGCASTQPGPQGMSFFVTSAGPGKGGDLGGLAGADRHCQSLAQSAGAGHRAWRAYLSTQGTSLTDANFVNARDRIGAGPWHNAKGALIARNVDELHSDRNNLNKETALDEKGRRVNSRSETPNKHDILTGSRPDGTAFPFHQFPQLFAGAQMPDMTCGNWTRSGNEGSAMTGHFDRAGPINAPWATSWNSSHPTLGCGLDRIRPTGGDGLFYCFAAN